MPSSRFIIYSETVDLSVATKMLRIQPSQQWKKGERQALRRKDGSIHVLDLIHKANGWKLSLPAADQKKELDEQIQRWLRILVPKKKKLAQIRELGAQMLLDCWTIGGSDSVSLPPKTLRELADIGVFFDVTFYASREKGPTRRQSQRRDLSRRVRSNHEPK